MSEMERVLYDGWDSMGCCEIMWFWVRLIGLMGFFFFFEVVDGGYLRKLEGREIVDL